MALYDYIAQGGTGNPVGSYLSGVNAKTQQQQAQQQFQLNQMKLAEAQAGLEDRKRMREYYQGKAEIQGMPSTGGEMPEQEFRKRELQQKYPIVAREDQLKEAEIQRQYDDHLMKMNEADRKKNAWMASTFSNIMFGVDKAKDPYAEYKARFPLLKQAGVDTTNLNTEFDPVATPAQIRAGIGAAKFMDKKGGALEGTMGTAINTTAKLFNLDISKPEDAQKAYDLAMQFKRELPEPKAEGKIYEKRMQSAEEAVKAASESKSNIDQFRYLVDREVNKLNGIEGFINKYNTWMGPQADLYQAGATILSSMGWNPDDENSRVFLAQVQQLNTDEAMKGMAQLGGNDSNEELKRVSAKFASITDYGPQAFLSKLWLMELSNNIDQNKAIAEMAAIDKEKTNFSREKFEKQWDKHEAKIINNWRVKYSDFLDQLAEKSEQALPSPRMSDEEYMKRRSAILGQ